MLAGLASRLISVLASSAFSRIDALAGLAFGRMSVLAGLASRRSIPGRVGARPAKTVAARRRASDGG